MKDQEGPTKLYWRNITSVHDDSEQTITNLKCQISKWLTINHVGILLILQWIQRKTTYEIWDKSFLYVMSKSRNNFNYIYYNIHVGCLSVVLLPSQSLNVISWVKGMKETAAFLFLYYLWKCCNTLPIQIQDDCLSATLLINHSLNQNAQ